MIEPKASIFTKLKEINGITVYQIRPEILSIDLFPIVTFFVSSNVPEYDLKGNIGTQDIEITIDIWGKTSQSTGVIMKSVVSKMLDLSYLCTHNMDVQDPEGFSHLNLRFNF